MLNFEGGPSLVHALVTMAGLPPWRVPKPSAAPVKPSNSIEEDDFVQQTRHRIAHRDLLLASKSKASAMQPSSSSAGPMADVATKSKASVMQPSSSVGLMADLAAKSKASAMQSSSSDGPMADEVAKRMRHDDDDGHCIDAVEQLDGAFHDPAGNPMDGLKRAEVSLSGVTALVQILGGGEQGNGGDGGDPQPKRVRLASERKRAGKAVQTARLRSCLRELGYKIPDDRKKNK